MRKTVGRINVAPSAESFTLNDRPVFNHASPPTPKWVDTALLTISSGKTIYCASRFCAVAVSEPEFAGINAPVAVSMRHQVLQHGGRVKRNHRWMTDRYVISYATTPPLVSKRCCWRTAHYCFGGRGGTAGEEASARRREQ